MKKEICYCDRCGEEIKTKTRFKYFNAKGELAKAIIE